MIILTKSIISLIIGFVFAILFGFIIMPILKKNTHQIVSKFINKRHLLKEGTPTMGGFIFIISTIIGIIVLLLFNKIKISYNFLIIIFTFISYGILGFLDDYQKIKYNNNKGLSIIIKFFIQFIIAILFFMLFIIAGNNTIIYFCDIEIDLKFIYGGFILFLLVGFSNAVNITDGLDGLCAGLCAISFLTYGIIAFSRNYIIGYEEIGVLCFIMAGSLLGFLFFNFYPAKVFMGDLGSLALGSTLAAIAIVLKCELSLIIIGVVYIIETLSSFLQIISIRVFNKKLFLKSPLHHHFEELKMFESDIIKIFYTFGLIFSLIAIIYYVWI